MLTQLTTIKSRLAIAEADLTYDTLITQAILAVGARFESECQRRFARTVDDTCEFSAGASEISVRCYPIESVRKFERKSSERAGWVEQLEVDYLVREGCIVALYLPLGNARDLGRITYTGGYVLPGTEPGAGQVPLPADLEQAVVEQVAWWFLNRDKLGLVRRWPHDGTYEQFAQLDLLLSVRAVLEQYRRWVV
jgi:hypothetical protein